MSIVLKLVGTTILVKFLNYLFSEVGKFRCGAFGLSREEIFKLNDIQASERFKKMRYELYSLEKNYFEIYLLENPLTNKTSNSK